MYVCTYFLLAYLQLVGTYFLGISLSAHLLCDRRMRRQRGRSRLKSAKKSDLLGGRGSFSPTRRQPGARFARPVPSSVNVQRERQSVNTISVSVSLVRSTAVCNKYMYVITYLPYSVLTYLLTVPTIHSWPPLSSHPVLGKVGALSFRFRTPGCPGFHVLVCFSFVRLQGFFLHLPSNSIVGSIEQTARRRRSSNPSTHCTGFNAIVSHTFVFGLATAGLFHSWLFWPLATAVPPILLVLLQVAVIPHRQTRRGAVVGPSFSCRLT